MVHSYVYGLNHNDLTPHLEHEDKYTGITTNGTLVDLTIWDFCECTIKGLVDDLLFNPATWQVITVEGYQVVTVCTLIEIWKK